MDKISLLLEKNNNLIKMLNFPSIRQSSSDNDLSVIQSILAYYGEDFNEEELFKDFVQVNSIISDEMRNVSVDNIIKYFTNKEYRVEAKQMNINDIIGYLNLDIPVILLIQSYGDLEDYSGWTNGNYIVSIGYTKNKILFEDPLSFYTTFLTYKELMERWHYRYDIEYFNFGIAVSGKSPKFDKNKWVKVG